MPACLRTVLAAGTLAAVSVAIVTEARAQERLDHLLQAAEHLERAGLAEKAAEIRQLAADDLRTHGAVLLERKRAQLESLQREIDRLQQAVSPVPQVKVALRICELQPAKLEASGLGLVSLRQLLSNPTPTSIVDDSGKLTEFIEFLQKQQIVATLSAPTLVTCDGRTATLEVGQRSAAAQQAAEDKPDGAGPAPDFCGLRFECRPMILDGGKLRLDLDLRHTERAAAVGDRAVGPPTDGLRTRLQLKTRVELQSGQTLVIGGSQAGREPGPDRGLLVLLKAETIAPGKEMPSADP
jgi:type II secretory pathway component GspD/PulD (secretin)